MLRKPQNNKTWFNSAHVLPDITYRVPTVIYIYEFWTLKQQTLNSSLDWSTNTYLSIIITITISVSKQQSFLGSQQSQQIKASRSRKPFLYRISQKFLFRWYLKSASKRNHFLLCLLQTDWQLSLVALKNDCLVLKRTVFSHNFFYSRFSLFYS